MESKTSNNESKVIAIRRTAVVSVVLLLSGLAFNIQIYNIQAASAAAESYNVSNTGPTTIPIANNATKLILALRDLWVDHTTWTRNYIISFLTGLPDTNLVAQRLLKNQEDLGNAIKPFYGSEAGNKFTSLLKDHISGVVELLKAAKVGNSTAAAIAEKDWYQNADQIATFLSNANPNNWPKQDLTCWITTYLSQSQKR